MPTMNYNPLVTILTLSLNNDKTLTKNIDSIKDQTFRDYEHLIIDGKSSDSTLKILHSYKNKYNLKWISEYDNGISDALNKGVEIANGKYIIVIQADDYLHDRYTLIKAFKYLESEEYDIVSYPILVKITEDTFKTHNPSRLINIRYHFKNVFRHQGTFIHKRLFSKIGFYNESYKISMDYDFFFRAISIGCTYKIGYFPVAVMGGYGISRTNAYDRILEEMTIQDSNENKIFWKVSQRLFRAFYKPYKKLTCTVNHKKHFLKQLI
jgi:glycosyltransferase involved in cell wall biosynthesis